MNRTILLRFFQARLTPGGQFGLHLTAGVLLLVLAVALFGELAGDMAELDGLAAFDQHVSDWMHRTARQAWAAPLTHFMLALTHMHSVGGMALLCLLLGLYFHYRRQRYWLLALLFTVPGGMLLNVLLKQVYQRARPVFDEPLLTLPTYSFPSGHTAAAALFYGLLAAYAVMSRRSVALRATAVAACLAMVCLVAISRIYLGVHFPTDTLAAAVEAVGWMAICITGCSTLRRRREARGLEAEAA